MSVTYPKICIANDGKYFIDFNLNDKRYRLYNGNKIKLKLNPNSFPVKHRRRQAELLAKKVYDHVVSNNYSFDKDNRSNELVLFDRSCVQIVCKKKKPLTKVKGFIWLSS